MVLMLVVVSMCLVLLVASIPIAMQVVCTSTMAIGSRRLAEKKAIVTRLASIEELAGMNIRITLKMDNWNAEAVMGWRWSKAELKRRKEQPQQKRQRGRGRDD